MAGFYAEGEDIAREHEKDLSRIPRDLEVYAHIEGLVGEENELLEEAEKDRKEEEKDRKEEQHERLHTVREELDRAWETLRRRAERRTKPGG